MAGAALWRSETPGSAAGKEELKAVRKALKIPPKRKSVSVEGASRKVGLARALSKLGYCSRQQAAALIREGKVQLNGTVSRNPEAPVRIGKDRLLVEGLQVAAATKLYIVMNKPRGIVTTAADEKGRETVYSLLPEDLPWLAPVGRLDKASEGLLLLTNDSEWNARVTDPGTHLEKIYHVQIGEVVRPELLDTLKGGLKAKDGELLSCKRASILRAGEKNSWLEIVLDEGKNRQIRRMLEALGISTLRLIRVAIGPLRLGDLPKGEHRPLTVGELEAMKQALR